MFPILRHLRLAIILAITLLLADPSLANAGWMGFRNETGSTLIIQETVTVASKSRPAKPQKIFVNETVRDTALSEGGQRKLTIYDAAHPDKVLYTGQFASPAANENVLFVIKSDSRGGIVIEAVRTPTGVVKTSPKK